MQASIIKTIPIVQNSDMSERLKKCDYITIFLFFFFGIQDEFINIMATEYQTQVSRRGRKTQKLLQVQ